MNPFMTFWTHRNNIIPMGFLIPFVMMILACPIVAIMAYKKSRAWQFSMFYKMIYSMDSSTFFRIAIMVSFCIYISTFSTFFAFIIAILSYLVFDAFSISGLGIFVVLCFLIVYSPFSLTIVTPTLEAISRVRMFAKRACGFNFFAFRALFCLNWLRHSLIPYIKPCSGPVRSYDTSNWLAYYTTKGGCVN